ncbi:MAG TPA: EscU/YscU/HrcU family type III secretion system export apparatus switch protein [Chloroflexota bacterium]|nr:EscU/YscU/HrcU family type III secretion system export apparatus switch protein [Chloroflexota bacterium]
MNARDQAPSSRRAVALRYTPGRDPAPVVAAAGRGPLAEEIVRRAQAAGVPVHEDAALADALATLAVGAVIPPGLYLAVAEVLAYIYRLEDQLARGR